MHEIPNLPFPSLHEPEQTNDRRNKPVPNSPSRKKPLTAARPTAKTETPPYRPRRAMRFPHCLNREPCP